MLALLDSLNHWHWLGLGLLLLVLEVTGAVGFLLWTGIAALSVGLLMVFIALSWQAQWLIFALQALLSTWLWWRYQQRQDRASHDPAAPINDRIQRYIGRELQLLDNVEEGFSRVRLDDSVWTVRCDTPLQAHDRVKVVGADSHILLVVAI